MRLSATLFFFLALATSACGGASEVPSTTTGSPNTGNTGNTGTETTPPENDQKVRAKIAAASLGSGGFGGSGAANVQLAFVSEATAPASVSVVKVVLVDQTNASAVQTLQASSPSVWNGSTYVSWNEKVTPGGDLRASYDLTTPDWSAIATGKNAYSITYKLRVTLSIDGAEVTIESDNLQREPEVAT